jgi:hypothetical protein
MVDRSVNVDDARVCWTQDMRPVCRISWDRYSSVTVR